LTEKQWVWLQSFREMGTEFEWLPELALYRLGHIYAKLGVRSRAAAVLEALDRGLIHRQDDGERGS
jgi:hypothetical protein